MIWGATKYYIFLDNFWSYSKKQKEVWNLSPCLIFCMSFEEKYLSCYYILLTEQVSLPGCFYFVRYWEIIVLQLFVDQVVTS